MGDIKGEPVDDGKEEQFHEFIVIGAGPAGAQLGYHLEKDKCDYVILERNYHAGSFFSKHPRHRQLISTNKRFNGFPEPEFNMRHDWNSLLSDDESLLFTHYSDKLFPDADDLVRYINDFVQKFELKIQYGVQINRIWREEKHQGSHKSLFHLRDARGNAWSCQCLILATGAVKSKLPEVEGIELCDVYDNHTLNLKEYENKNIAIIGGGNSAFEVGNHICGHAANVHFILRHPVKFSWDTHFVGNLRAVNNTVLDMYHLKSMHALRNIHPRRIWKEEDGTLSMEHDLHLPHWDPPGTGRYSTKGYHKIICCTGWKYIDTDIFDKTCVPEIHTEGKFPVLNDMWESTVPDLYFAGTNMQSKDRRTASGFIHGFRYNCRVLYHLLRLKYHGTELPMQVFEQIDLGHLIDFLIKRLSTTSALYQMGQGFLVDMMVLEPEDNTDNGRNEVYHGKVKYYYELPSEWLYKQKMLSENKCCWVLSLVDHHDRYGDNYSVTEFFIPPDMNNTNQLCSAFVRPVIRCYSYGKLTEELELNGSIIVRSDITIYTGDNSKERYKNTLRNLLFRQTGLGSDGHYEKLFTPDVWKNVFIPWNEEEKLAYKKKMEAMNKKPVAQCSFLPNF